MKFLLINSTEGMLFSSSKNKYSNTGSSATPPLGLLYVASSLEEEGHSVELIDYYCEKDPEKKILQSCRLADAVGLGVYTTNYEKTSLIAKLIKENNPDIPLIIGGPHCTFHPNNSLRDLPEADISIDGEGEFVIKDIVKTLNGEKKLSEINGVYYRLDNEIKKGKDSIVIKDLDSLVFPSRHIVEKYNYGLVSGVDVMKRKFTTLMTSRGCPHKCRFCTRHVTTMKTYRERSVDNVISELEELDDKYRSVMIVDDNFTGNRKRSHKILDGIIEKELEFEIAIIGVRVDSAEKSLYEKMKKAGVKILFFGIESGNQDVLNFYNKKTTLEQIKYAINLSNEMDFFSIGTFIIGAPIETKEHINRTIKLACSLPLDIAVFTPLFYEKGSDLWEEACKNGKINEKDCYIVMADKKRGLSNFTYEELAQYSIEASKKFYRRPSYIINELFGIIRRRDFHLIKIGLNYI